jgi:endonuclease III
MGAVLRSVAGIDYTNGMGRNTIQKTANGKRKTPTSKTAPSVKSARSSKSTPGKSPAGPKVPTKAPGRKQGRPKPWTPAEVAEAFRRLKAANPEPRGELEYINPFTLLVAVVLSAQATDSGVNKATRALFEVVDTPQKMVALGETRLRDYIKTIGLYNTKAKNVIALSEKLIAEHGGEVPAVRAVLETLPGVGRKTANVVLNIAFGEETFAVDTHVFRVGNRTGMAPGKTPFEVELRLEEVVPPPYRVHAHHWLILHGRYICKAQRPLCEKCPINDLCQWPEKAAFMGG